MGAQESTRYRRDNKYKECTIWGLHPGGALSGAMNYLTQDCLSRELQSEAFIHWLPQHTLTMSRGWPWRHYPTRILTLSWHKLGKAQHVSKPPRQRSGRHSRQAVGSARDVSTRAAAKIQRGPRDVMEHKKVSTKSLHKTAPTAKDPELFRKNL